MKRFRLLIYTALFIITFAISVVYFSKYFPSAQAATASHVVISEIKLGTSGNVNDEFVELYNPTSNPVNLMGWKLRRETETNISTPSALVASMSGEIISHGFFLITSPESEASSSADIQYSTGTASNRIAASNTVVILDKNNNVIDKVGFGTATDVEGNPAVSLTAGKSIERKANSSSTAISMAIGGADEFAGNGEDTDNNSADFVLRNLPEPQNSSSPIEPPLPTPTLPVTDTPIPSNSPTVTTTPTLIPTDTPTLTPTESPIPTITPTNSPTPTMTPRQTPTPTFTPTVTLTPTPSPTMTPTPTLSPTPSLAITPTLTLSVTPTPTITEVPTLTPTLTQSEPSVSPTATPTPTTSATPTLTIAPSGFTPTPMASVHEFHFPHLVCTWKVQEITIGRFHFSIPFFHCFWDRR